MFFREGSLFLMSIPPRPTPPIVCDQEGLVSGKCIAVEWRLEIFHRNEPGAAPSITDFKWRRYIVLLFVKREAILTLQSQMYHSSLVTAFVSYSKLYVTLFWLVSDILLMGFYLTNFVFLPCAWNKQNIKIMFAS